MTSENTLRTHPERATALHFPRTKCKALPEYLEHSEVDSLIAAAHDARAAVLMLLQWRAGLRISEAVRLTPADLHMDSDRPTLVVRLGKGRKPRVVPVHDELRGALRSAISFGVGRVTDPIIGISRQSGLTWVKAAYARAVALGTIAPGRKIGTHTLRHSAARHWLMHGVPINQVQVWLGHARLSTTLIYLQIMPDPAGRMSRVP